MRLVKKRLLVLLSGRGSNLLALADWLSAHAWPLEIGCVVSNRPEAAGLSHAQARGLTTRCFDPRALGGMEGFEAALEQELAERPADLIVLAGFMRILSPAFCERHAGQILNIHPSLLPSFSGLNTHERALAAGVRVHGATVHLVSAELDAGPILAQGLVPVLHGDSAESLAARVLEIEHQIFPPAIAAVAGGLMRPTKAGWQPGDAAPGFEELVFSPLTVHKALIT